VRIATWKKRLFRQRHRLGISKVGVFKPDQARQNAGQKALCVIPFKSLDALAGIEKNF